MQNNATERSARDEESLMYDSQDKTEQKRTESI